MPHPPVRKAVFPVAGLGTRFLPATKAIPKEMLPVADRPLIQYAVEEAVAAGAEQLVFVTGRGKQSIADHFDRAPELEAELEADGKEPLLRAVRETLPAGVSCVFVRQPRALGLGHAVLCAQPVIGDEPFFVVLPDDLILGAPRPCLVQMRDAHAGHGQAVLAVEEVPREDTGRYGIVALADGGGSWIEAIVEKPAPADAPSTLGVVGRYLLTPAVWAMLSRTTPGAGGEIQLTDAIALMLDQAPVHALRFEGRRHDCGSMLGYLQANVDAGLAHPGTGEALRAWLSEIIK